MTITPPLPLTATQTLTRICWPASSKPSLLAPSGSSSLASGYGSAGLSTWDPCPCTSRWAQVSFGLIPPPSSPVYMSVIPGIPGIHVCHPRSPRHTCPSIPVSSSLTGTRWPCLGGLAPLRGFPYRRDQLRERLRRCAQPPSRLSSTHAEPFAFRCAITHNS